MKVLSKRDMYKYHKKTGSYPKGDNGSEVKPKMKEKKEDPVFSQFSDMIPKQEKPDPMSSKLVKSMEQTVSKIESGQTQDKETLTQIRSDIKALKNALKPKKRKFSFDIKRTQAGFIDTVEVTEL